MKEIAGVIYPVPKQFVNRLLDEKRNVFVKYIPKVSNVKIAPKQKVLFYESRGSKEIVGEGRIEKILFLTASEALEKYGNLLFLNRDELTEYSLAQPKRNPSKKMLVLVLSKLNRYGDPKKFKKPINMNGQYLSPEEYEELFT